MNIKRCRESFAYWVDGVPRDCPAGTLIDADRTSWYKGRELLFDDVDVYVDQQEARAKPYTVPEAATANPGEQRSVSVATPAEVTTEPSTGTQTVNPSRFQAPKKEAK